MKHLSDLGGRVAIVFGAAGGLGSAHARRLAAAGARLVVVDRKDSALEAVVDACPGARGFAIDCADGEALGEVIERVEREEGPIARAVHAVGVMPAGPALATAPATTLDAMAINFGSVVHLATSLLPRMVDRRAGVFVVYGSFSGVAPNPRLASYCASKAAVNAYVEVLMNELRDTGVLIHLAIPTGIRTPMIEGAKKNGGPRAMSRAGAVHFLADPSRVAESVDRAVARGATMSRAGNGSLVFGALRAFAPSLLWAMYRQMEGAPDVPKVD